MPDLCELKADKCTKTLNIDILLKGKRHQLCLKRIFDFTASLLGIIVLCPFLLLIAILIKIDSKGPVLFRQVRVGKHGKKFKILKFRTMIADTEEKGMQITVGNDYRITKLGHFLRKFKIDELPQLINVMIGDMSFVGPRPEVPRYVAIYDERQRDVLKLRPGITDLASIEYRDENTLLAESNDPEKTYIDSILPKKIELNMEYLEKMSIIYDFRLILKTILVVLK